MEQEDSCRKCMSFPVKLGVHTLIGIRGEKPNLIKVIFLLILLIGEVLLMWVGTVGLLLNSILVLILLLLAGYGLFQNLKTTLARVWEQARTTIDDISVVYRFLFPRQDRGWRKEKRERKQLAENFRWLRNELKRDLLSRAVQHWWLFGYAAIAASSGWLGMLRLDSPWVTAYGWSIGASVFILLLIGIPSWLRHAPWIGKLFLAAYMLIMPMALLLVAYVRVDKQSLTLSYILFALAYALAPMVVTIKVVLDEGKSPWVKAGVGLLGYLGSFTYAIWLVGLFITGKPSLDLSIREHFVEVLSTGAKYVLSYQTTPGLIPLVAYQIGFLINTVTVGFFISYAASLIYTAFQNSKEAEHRSGPFESPDSTASDRLRREEVVATFVPNTTGECSGKIKGYLSSKGRRFYITPTMPRYNECKAAYCFETERDASEAGFVKSNK